MTKQQLLPKAHGGFCATQSLSSYTATCLHFFSRVSLILLLLMTTIPMMAQTKFQSLNDVCEPYESLEFLTIKNEIQVSKEVFLRDYLSLLSLTSGSEMRFVRSKTNDVGVTSSLYQQYLNGYKVKGAEMMINEKGGVVKYINGRYMTTTPNGKQVMVDEKNGLAIAQQQVSSTDYLWQYPEAEAAYRRFKKDSAATYKPIGELMYIPDFAKPFDQQSFRLVWRFAIHVNPQVQSSEVFLDAQSGEVISKIPLTYECSSGTSTTLWNGAQNIFTQLSGGSYRSLSDCNSAQVHTYNGNGNDNGVGATYYTDTDNDWPITNLGKYIAQAHWGSKQTRNYYAVIHSREGYDDAGADFITYLNPGYTGNAYWTGSGTSFGGSSTGASPYVTLDVCGHEHTHGMIDFTSNLTYSYESGALNESFADCIGEAVEEYTLGSADWIHRFEISGGNRSFISPNAMGDPDTYLGTNWYTGAADAGGVHTNSGVQNYWFYLLSVGGSGTNDNGNAFSVSGITIDKARLIAYDCMVGLISSSQYANARTVSIQKAKDRYGDCSDEAEQTTRAWYAVGVGSNWVAPTPLTISASVSPTSICQGESTTGTATGAATYTWLPSGGSGSSVTLSPTTTTVYTVTGTNAESCTGTKTVTVQVNNLPAVNPTTSDNELCTNQSSTLIAGSNATINSLLTTLAGGNGLSGNAFDIHAYNNITITDFKMNLDVTTDSVEVWFKSGGYGNANITSNTGWTKLGATVPVVSAGQGNLTTIPTTVNLTIGAGATYGIIILSNGSNVYSNGTSVGSIEASNSDLYITQGHGGSGFGGTFNFPNSPRVFNGTVEYRTNFTNYAWSPSATLSSSTVANPVASPTASTIYTLTVTDGNGCTGTGSLPVYLYPLSSVSSTSATPSTICSGASSQLNVTTSTPSSSQTLLTDLNSNNGNAGNVFDIHAINAITITNVRMNIVSGDSAQVWYKVGGYGNAAVTSSAGWTKLGSTVAITAAGMNALTLIPTTANLSIPAGATYGIAVICNNSNRYINGTAVGNVAFSNPDLEITEGHGGTGFNGFSFTNSPRVFSGRIDYTVTNSVASYLWTPNGGTLTSSTIQNPVASPRSTTDYNITITDAHGCTATSIQNVNVNPISNLITSATPNPICPGDSTTLSVVNALTERDSLFTTLTTDNSNAGNAFNVITTKPITIRSFKMHLASGTQIEAWYKPGGYGNASFTGTAGWTKIGSTLTVVAAGTGNLTTATLSTPLTIPAASTYGIMLVSNGTVNYLNGLTAVGSVYANNADLSVTVGHGGTGIGAYAFAAFPRVWSGEIVYDVENTLSSYVWSPSTAMSSITAASPKVAPSSNTIYSVTTTDVNGCTATASIGVNVSPLPTLGTATATPSILCQGSTTSLNYTQPGGTSCVGAFQTGFAGTYAPANWTAALVNSNGSVNTASAPSQITLTSSNGLSGSGQTNYTITIPCTGIVTFNWTYSTADAGPQYDLPKYAINGGAAINFPTFKAQNGDPRQQTGSVSLAMTAGQTLTLQAYSSDNLGGSASLIIQNFSAPYQTTASQTVKWYTASTGGSNFANGTSFTHTPAASGNFTYYAQITNSITGCTNSSRAATNSVTVNPQPNVIASASPGTICATSSTTLTANNASTYVWQPGGLTGSTVVVTPTTTTTYTVTGTTALGCTKTTTVTVTVNPLPVIAGSAAPSIVCPGAAVTLTGTTTGVTWIWQPGNLTGTPVVVNPTAQTTYTVTATSAAGCAKTATFVILMNPVPSVTTSSVPTTGVLCGSSNATITATSATATSYLWQPGASTTPSVIVNTPNTYTVTVTNSQGCTASATKVITTGTNPIVGTTITNSVICAGGSTAITGTGASTYTWQPGSLSGTTVTVTPAATTTYTVTGTNASGCTATALRSVTVIALPSIVANATLSTINCPNSTTLSATGGISYTWQPGSLSGSSVTVSPATTTTYTVTGVNANGCANTATKTITVVPCASSVLTLSAFLQGYYIGGNTMNSTLSNEGAPNPSNHTDTITVELHNATSPYTLVQSAQGILLTNGTATCTFPASVIGTYYYIAVKHRNSIETWSSNPVLSTSAFSYNFTNNITKAYGDNLAELESGIFAIYSGDINQDGFVDSFDYPSLDTDIFNGVNGVYVNTDLNGDGFVDSFDYPVFDTNSSNGVSAITP